MKDIPVGTLFQPYRNFKVWPKFSHSRCLLNASTEEYLDEGKTDQDKSLPPTPATQPAVDSNKDEKRELMERMQPPKGTKPIDAAKQKGDKWVRDPVTGQQVLLKNPQMKGKNSIIVHIINDYVIDNTSSDVDIK